MVQETESGRAAKDEALRVARAWLERDGVIEAIADDQARNAGRIQALLVERIAAENEIETAEKARIGLPRRQFIAEECGEQNAFAALRRDCRAMAWAKPFQRAGIYEDDVRLLGADLLKQDRALEILLRGKVDLAAFRRPARLQCGVRSHGFEYLHALGFHGLGEAAGQQNVLCPHGRDLIGEALGAQPVRGAKRAEVRRRWANAKQLHARRGLLLYAAAAALVIFS